MFLQFRSSILFICLVFVIAFSNGSGVAWATPRVNFGAAVAMAAEQTKPEVTPAQKRVVFDYRLAPGDAVAIEVFGEPDLSKEYTVGESGRIAFPLLGEVVVMGMKTKQIEKMLVQRLKDGYLVNPRVNVSIRAYRSVYVNGQVKSPNGYPFVPGMTVRKLISIAGGFTERASKSRIYVISDSSGANESPRKIKLDAEVRPGDIISVEESFF